MLSLSHQFLFIHVPKTAGNSLQRALLEYSEDRAVVVGPRQDGIERFEIRSPGLDVHKHSSLSDYQQQLSQALFGRLYKFACVRNPWDRCVSHFFSPHRGSVDWSPEAFGNFIDLEVRPLTDYLDLGQGDPSAVFGNVDDIIRFESLESDFAKVCDVLGLGPVKLPHVNASSRRDYRRYYVSSTLIEKVATRFAAEIQYFDYTFK